MLKEETICKFQQGKDKLHLLKLTNKEETTKIFKRYLANTVGGYKLHLETGEIIPIKDNEIKIIIEKYNLKKDNENYYYYNSKEDYIKTKERIVMYQVRHNRKRIKTSKYENEMRKLFAVMAQNIILQLKIY